MKWGETEKLGKNKTQKAFSAQLKAGESFVFVRLMTRCGRDWVKLVGVFGGEVNWKIIDSSAIFQLTKRSRSASASTW